MVDPGVNDKLADADGQEMPRREPGTKPARKFTRSVLELFFDHEIIKDDMMRQKG
jgi:hypothetical protein